MQTFQGKKDPSLWVGKTVSHLGTSVLQIQCSSRTKWTHDVRRVCWDHRIGKAAMMIFILWIKIRARRPFSKHLIWFSSFSDEEAHTEEVTCSKMQLMGGKTKASLDLIRPLHHNCLKNEKWHQLFRPPRSRCLPHCLLCPSVEGSNESNFCTPIPDVMSPLPWYVNSVKLPYSRTVMPPRIYLPGEQLERNELERPFFLKKILITENVTK